MITLVVALSLLGSPEKIDQEGIGFFEKKIRPVLVEHCYQCHSADSKSLKADLRLDLALPPSNPLVVPSKPEESRLIEAIRYGNSDLQMPPKSKLPDAVIRDFEEWVRRGAADPREAAEEQGAENESGIDLARGREHWAFQPIRTPTPPLVSDASWAQSPIDHFVLARLDAAGLSPSPAADRRTLLRRVTFDLTGLPPTPEDLQAFLADDSPNAFAKVVDTLLASPAYAERWARHWLDVARYGDCNGADESIAFPHAYHYRNYVIDSFHRDLPYDRFVAEQVAGDLFEARLDEPSPYDPMIGTGFLAMGTKIVAERDVEKMKADVIDEQIDTFGRAFLALTLGCARCHDHKFDPIPTSDYYALSGILKSTRTMSKPGSNLERAARTGEYFVAATDYERFYRRRAEEVETMLQSLKSQATRNATSAKTLEFEAETFARGNVVIDNETYGTGIGIVGDRGAKASFAEYDVTLDTPGLTLVQFRYAAKDSRPVRLLGNGEVIAEQALAQTTGDWYPDGQRWFTEGTHRFRQGKNVLRFENDGLLPHIDKVRLVSLSSVPGLVDTYGAMDRLEKEKADLDAKKPSRATVMAVEEGKVQNDRIHIRGSHLRLGDEVPRGLLQVIASEEEEPFPDDESGRRQLAEWLTSKRHPLTSRVMVNRIWRWYFGRGIVASTDNFGLRGEKPSHPDLLDYLASEFIEAGWSIKALHRRILLSSTYQMAHRRHEASENLDPDNRLLWRFRRRRLEAEAIRDALLFVTERLDFEVGGAPLTLKSFEPTPEDLENNRKFYESSRRRTIYLPVLRTNLYELLTLFDFANPDLSTGSRVTTTLPTQALMIMNAPYVETHATHLAQRMLDAAEKDDGERLRRLYLRLYSRVPSEEEIATALSFVQDFERTLEATTDPTVRRLKAWGALCHMLLAANEFFYID